VIGAGSHDIHCVYARIPTLAWALGQLVTKVELQFGGQEDCRADDTAFVDWVSVRPQHAHANACTFLFMDLRSTLVVDETRTPTTAQGVRTARLVGVKLVLGTPARVMCSVCGA